MAPPGDSFEGIVVPEGEPGSLRASAQRLTAMAGAVETVEAGLRGLPSDLAAWRGTASAAFGAATVPAATALLGARTAFDAYAPAIRMGAERLETAQREAERAIEEARDARRRIERAEAAIEDAQGRLATAEAASAALGVALAATGPVGELAGLESQRADADAAAARAEAELAHARAELRRAQEDLEQAKRRGSEAEDEAREAKRAVADVLAGLAPTTGGLALTGGPAGGGGGGGPVFGPNGEILRLDLTVEEFDRMTLEQRQHWMAQFQRQFGPAGNFDGWFRNIEGILQFAGERDTITPGSGSTPGSWFSLVDAAILHGIQSGYAQSRGRSVGTSNPGSARWREFFDYRRGLQKTTIGPSEDLESKKRWAAGEQASTDYGVNVVAPQNGRIPNPQERFFLWVGDRYRKDIVPNLEPGSPGYTLLDPRNQEFTRDAAEGLYDTSGEAVEGARETVDEGLEAAREITEAPPSRRNWELVEGVVETEREAFEGVVETGGQLLDTVRETADDVVPDVARVVVKQAVPGL
jgi:hypothetical protein